MRNDGCYKYFITGKGFRKFNYTIPKGWLQVTDTDART
jgi:hypothetical protein